MHLIHQIHQPHLGSSARTDGLGQRVGSFAVHFFQMCAVMCIGALVVCGSVFGLFALLGFGDLLDRAPVVAALVLGAGLAVPMLLWMRHMGMSRQLAWEMAAAPIAVCLAVIALYAGDVLDKAALLETQARLACPMMLAVMLARFRHYATSQHT
jgi:hypothetical protein